MRQANPSLGRDTSLDVARGIAIVAVVLGHVIGGLVDSGLPRSIPDWTLDLVHALYLTHLPVFAFVTGLLMPSGIKRMGRGPYLFKRLSLLAYLYLLWTLIEGSTEVLTSQLKNHATTWSDVIAIWHPIAHLWFLPTLAVGTAVVVAIRPWRRQPYAYLQTGGVILGSLLAWGWSYPLLGAHGLTLVGWMTLGALVNHSEFSAALARAGRGPLSSVGAVGLVLLVMAARAPQVTAPTVAYGERTAVSVAIGVIGSVAGVVLVLSISALMSRGVSVTRTVAYVGRMSLPIYLAHIIFAAGTRVALGMVGVSGFLLLAIAGTAVGVLGPLMLERGTRGVPWLFTPPWQAKRLISAGDPMKSETPHRGVGDH